MRYESEFGVIKVPNQQPAPIAPLNFGKGDA